MEKSNITYSIHELSALFPPETAGRDMITKIPVFRPEAKVLDTKKHLIDKASDYETINYIYIVDDESQIVGVVSIRELLHAAEKSKLKDVMVKNVIAANPMDNVPHVALLALQNNLKMIPIVDHKKRLVGAFSSNQLLDILNKQFSNDLLRLSGISVPRKHFSFVSWKVVFSRLPWMLIGMIGGLATGTIIGVFQSSIEAVVLLAVFIPVIMSTGATSANQSAMIFLRNLVHGDIKNRGMYILNEIKVAGLLALILGGVLYLILSVFPGRHDLALAVSISLAITIMAGALIGVFTPMLLNRFKQDPSIGAGPFLTIIKDLVAMTIYFSVATTLLAAL